MRAADKNNRILVAERKEGPRGLKWCRKAFRRGSTGAGAQGLGRATGGLTRWRGVGSRDEKDRKEWRQGHQTDVS